MVVLEAAAVVQQGEEEVVPAPVLEQGEAVELELVPGEV